MTLGHLSRSVSIIGVGMTKFGDPLVTAEVKGMSLQDLGAWACASAMEDAGVNPQQIDKCAMGMVCSSYYNSNCFTALPGFLDFIGMRGKAGSFHNEACATGFNCFNDAVESVASGKYAIAICVDTDGVQYTTAPERPSSFLYPLSEYKNLYGRDVTIVQYAHDTAYVRWTGASYAGMDQCCRHYMRDTGITSEQLGDAFVGASITARQHGKLNPRAAHRTLWEEAAKQRGLADAKDFLKSSTYDPFITEYLRVAYMTPPAHGAAAVIVCATDIAKQFKQQPIEVVNTAQCDLSALTANLEQKMTRVAVKKLYEATGYKPEDIEYLQTTDMDLSDMVDSAEAVGYLPKGEGWKYFRDGRTRFDKDKPINTNGGHVAVGHAFAATGLSTICECVWQMRGQAGERQIPKPPKVVMMRGQGGGQSVSVSIFRTQGLGTKNRGEAEPPKFKPQPTVKMFYEALDRGKFLGMKCPACGGVEFPPYPVCNNCGHIGNELVELSGDATVMEVYKLLPVFTTPEYAPYAPLFFAESKLAEGPEFTSLIFGITPETYEKTRDSVPLKGKLVPLPYAGQGFNTFAIGINGAVPKTKEGVGREVSKEYASMMSGGGGLVERQK